MKAVVFHGLGGIRLDTVPEPRLKERTDAIVRLTASATCGTFPGVTEGAISQVKPMQGAIEACKPLDLRRPGRIKVELTPGS